MLFRSRQNQPLRVVCWPPRVCAHNTHTHTHTHREREREREGERERESQTAFNSCVATRTSCMQFSLVKEWEKQNEALVNDRDRKGFRWVLRL